MRKRKEKKMENLYKLPKDLLIKLICMSNFSLEGQTEKLHNDLLELKRNEDLENDEKEKIKKLINLYLKTKYFIISNYLAEFREEKEFYLKEDGADVKILLNFDNRDIHPCSIRYIPTYSPCFSIIYLDESSHTDKDNEMYVIRKLFVPDEYYPYDLLIAEITRLLNIDLSEEETIKGVKIFKKYLEYLKLCSAFLYTEP